MRSLAETQIEHIERLIERQQSMTRLSLGDDYMTVSVGEIKGAMAEAAQEWVLESRGIKYLDPMVQPPEDELIEGKAWAWNATAQPPHWAIVWKDGTPNG